MALPPNTSMNSGAYASRFKVVNRIGAAHDAHPSFGPAIFTAATLWFVMQVIVAWVFSPSYSLVTNTISDLGETSCRGSYGNGMCSPRWRLMDYVGFLVLGVVMAVGSALLYHEFTERDQKERRAAMVGFSLMALGGLGAMLVGFFPENVNRTMHIIGAFLAIGLGNVSIFALGALLTFPDSMRRSMLTFSSLSALALVCFASHKYFGIGGGTMERLAAYPEIIWLIMFGLYIWRFHPKQTRVYT